MIAQEKGDCVTEECGNDVSDQANACPHCGYEMAVRNEPATEDKKEVKRANGSCLCKPPNWCKIRLRSEEVFSCNKCKRENRMKIKELYGCEYEASEEELYPLQVWYNQLIDKTIQEITPGDVARMLRQKVLPGLAMTKAIELLQENPFVGELYEGEILAAIAMMESSSVTSYTEELQAVLKDASERIAAYEWYYDGEEDEFKEIVDSVARKIV